MAELGGRELELVSEIGFNTRGRKRCHVKLCTGDLTTLDENVDLLVLSSFPNDYTETSVSLIGALARNLGLHVRELAADKEEDLRETHNCWLSKPLEDRFKFGRVMCLELAGRDPHNVVGSVFRSIIAMAPETKSLIMPVLFTGAAGGVASRVVEGVVRAFRSWSFRGLQTTEVTIVMYKEDPPVLATFGRLREAFDKPPKQEVVAPAPSFGAPPASLGGGMGGGKGGGRGGGGGRRRGKSQKKSNKKKKEKEKLAEAEAEVQAKLGDDEGAQEEESKQGGGGSLSDSGSEEEELELELEEELDDDLDDDDDDEAPNADLYIPDLRHNNIAEDTGKVSEAPAAPRKKKGPRTSFLGRLFGKKASKQSSAPAAAAPPGAPTAAAAPVVATDELENPPPHALSSQKPRIIVTFASGDKDIMLTLHKMMTLALSESGNAIELVELEGESIRDDPDLVDLEAQLSKATKVLALITPAFIRCPGCLDAFNVALYLRQGVLLPVLTRTTRLPRYMTLVQYQDARPGNFRSLFPAIMVATDPREIAALAMGDLMLTDSSKTGRKPSTAARPLAGHRDDEEELTNGKRFDVFISYSQRFAQQARAAKEILEHLLPGVRCFLDTMSLQTGGSWQKMLYDSLDSSHVILSLLSPAYFSSPFCKDELAIAKLVRDERRGDLFATTVLGFESECPDFLHEMLNDQEPLHKCCQRVVDCLKIKRADLPLPVLRETRKEMHELKMDKLLGAEKQFEKASRFTPPVPPSVVLICPETASDTAAHLKLQLDNEELFTGTAEVLVIAEDDQRPDLGVLESCTFIVPLLSDAFVANQGCMAGLHMALFRNRAESRCLLPLLEAPLDGATAPSFVRLLPAVDLEAVDSTRLAELTAKASLLAASQRFDDFQSLPAL